MRPEDRTSFSWAIFGALTTAGPLVALLALLLARGGAILGGHALIAAAVAAGLATSAAGAVLHRARGVSRVLVLLGVATPLGLAADALPGSPALTFVLGMGGGIAIGAVFLAPFVDAAPRVDPADGRAIALRWSSYTSLGAWIGLLIAGLDGVLAAQAAAATALAVTTALTVQWAAVAMRVHPARVRFSSSLAGALWLGALVLRDEPVLAVTLLSALPLSHALLVPGAGGWLSSVIGHPARLLVMTFLLLSLVGTGLLALPVAAEDGRSIGLLDAAFTAVSAVCVTGLIVVDTPQAFGFVGEAAILLLIQIGGLGIMTFYSAALAALGRRLSLQHEMAVAGALGVERAGGLFAALARVLRVTFVFEAGGALILFLAFLAHGDSVAGAAWRGVFTAVSAFCNAGFALQTSSLIPYQSAPWILHTVAVLIVAGGLSPAVIAAMPSLARGRPIDLQARLVGATTAILLLTAFVGFALFEWTHTLADLPLGTRLNNAWFQSVTLRTAGFNSVDLADSRPATQTMMLVMMFIGGSPGGTAGGAKTTTLAILALAVIAALGRRSDAVAFGRRVGHVSVYKAAAVMTMGLLAAIGALGALQLTQRIPLDVAVFEAVSALGTVGLSIGGTAALDPVGKVIIMLCMFMGRVGPLTLFLFLTEHGVRPAGRYPEEEVDAG